MSPRGNTPLITVEIPANDECDDEEIARNLTKKHYKKGGADLEFDIVSPPVRITGRDPNTGKVVLKETYDPQDWDCLEDFLEHLRRGLPDVDDPERVKALEEQLASVRESLKFAYRDVEERKQEYKQLHRQKRVSDKAVVDESRLLDIVGLERRVRARGDLEQLGGITLHRWSHPVISRIVKASRRALKRI